MKVVVKSEMKIKCLFVVLLVIIGLAQVTFAQTINQTQNKADQTMRGSARVNPSTLGMELSIPLGMYPGRGGNRIPLTLDYSSKVWGTWKPDTWFTSLGTPYANLRSLFAKGSVRGWRTSLQVPQIEFPDDRYATTQEGEGLLIGEPDGMTTLYYVKRVKVIMPDGSVHEMRESDNLYVWGQTGGSFDYTGTYLSVDGSKMRLEITQSQTTLFYPNGERFIAGNGSSIYIDANGNKTIYNSSTYQWTDTLGRALTNPLPSTQTELGTFQPTEGIQTYEFPGFNGQAQQVKFIWAKLSTQQSSPAYLTKRLCSSFVDKNLPTGATVLFSTPGSQSQACDPNTTPFDPIVLTEVRLQNGTAYKFHYNLYGEIDKIEYPTGAYEKFEYGQITPLQSANNPAYDQFNRGVKKRWLSSDGTTGTEILWRYDVTRVNQELPTDYYKVKMTAPDNSYTERYLFDQDSDLQAPYGFGNIAIGAPYDERVYSTTGELIKRKLTKYVKTGHLPSGYTEATRDFRPNKEITVTSEPGYSYALVKMSEIIYETPGQNDVPSDASYFAALNQKQIKTFHSIALSTSTAADPNTNIDTFINLFANSTPASVNEADYLYNSNYKDKNITGLTTEARILNPSNPTDIWSESQVVYDEQNQYYSMIDYGSTTSYEAPTGTNTFLRGNPTTKKTWIKDSNSWVEKHTQFDNFGNVRKVWDLSNNQNRFIENEYDPLYKYAYITKVKVPAPDPTGIHGMTTGSETISSFDFTTGLLLSFTDANGQASTIEYDNILRPKKVTLPAGGSISETIFNDDINDLWIKVRQQIDENNWAEKRTYFDKLNRPYKTQTKDRQGDVFTEVRYDNLGRIEKSQILTGKASKYYGRNQDMMN